MWLWVVLGAVALVALAVFVLARVRKARQPDHMKWRQAGGSRCQDLPD